MSILFIFLILENILERFVPLLNFSDELITIVAFILICAFSSKIKITKNELIVMISFLITIVIGLLSNLLSGFSLVPIAVIKDVVEISKFFVLYIFATSFLYKGISKSEFKIICDFSKIYIVILFISGIISQFINIGLTNGKRYFIHSFTFLYTHETFLVSSLIILISILLVENDIKNKYFVFMGFSVLILTMRSKAIIFILMVVGLEILWRHQNISLSNTRFLIKHNRSLLIIVAIILSLTMLFLKNKFMLYVGYGMRAARPALYIVSFKIMHDFFPLGTGFGKFASYISTAYNSSVYTQYGIQFVNGLSYATRYAYVSDTYWPYIFGELGVFGTISYITGILFVFKDALGRIGKNRGMSIAVIATFSYLVFACFAESLLTNSNIVIFALAFGYYFNVSTDNF